MLQCCAVLLCAVTVVNDAVHCAVLSLLSLLFRFACAVALIAVAVLLSLYDDSCLCCSVAFVLVACCCLCCSVLFAVCANCAALS
jgi:hypothetical protein